MSMTDQRRCLAGLLILLLLLASRGRDPVPPVPTPDIKPKPVPALKQALESLQADGLKATVEALASEPRQAAGEAMQTATQWARDRLTHWGLPTELQPFEWREKRFHNLYAWIPGKDQGRVYVVGAHLDSVAASPGADDNASGSAVVLELARAFSLVAEQLPCTLVFQLYSGEELGLLGSRHYCNYPLFPRDKPDIKAHRGMWNFDMVGRLGRQSVDRCLRVNAASTSSDHAPFRKAGAPTCWYFTGTHGDLHRPGDTQEKLDYAGMQEIARHAFQSILDAMNGTVTLEPPPVQSEDQEGPWLDHEQEPFGKE